MSKINKLAALEALLFTAGDPISLSVVAETLKVDQDEANILIESLAFNKANDCESGLCVRHIAGGYILNTKEKYGRFLKEKYAQPFTLSSAALETLAVVAFQQPVTRIEIEKLRGVTVDRSLATLAEKGLIEECGRLDVPGRPILYQVTSLFLKNTGLNEVEEIKKFIRIENEIVIEEDVP